MRFRKKVNELLKSIEYTNKVIDVSLLVWHSIFLLV